MIKISDNLRKYAMLAESIEELKEYSENPPVFINDFEGFASFQLNCFERIVEFRERIRLGLMPRYSVPLIDHLDSIREPIQNPFRDHDYWEKEATAA